MRNLRLQALVSAARPGKHFSGRGLIAASVASLLVSYCSAAMGQQRKDSVSEEQSQSLWVAPDGRDEASGDQGHPFRTLERARDEVRRLNAAQPGDIVVTLRGGHYRLDRPLVLNYLDSGRNGHFVVYRAAPGERPVISGACRVGPWTLHDAGLNIYRAEVGDLRARQLYVNGERATRARTEPYPAGFRPVFNSGYPNKGGIEYIPTLLNPIGWLDPTRWTNVQKIEAVVNLQWKMASVPLSSIIPYPDFTPDLLTHTGLITLQDPGWTNANVFFAYNEITKKYEPGIWSFWQVTRFENAYQFLDSPGEWYLDESAGVLYYIPRWGENLDTADVELPVVEVLVDGQGEPGQPVSNIRFEGLTFSYATWLGPSTGNGYVSDQSGFHLVGDGHLPNIIGHDKDDERTPGNVRFRYARHIQFKGSTFEHLGAVGLDFDTGSQQNTISGNEFRDISSAAIQLGGISIADHHPDIPEQVTSDNLISDNLVLRTGRDYVDAAGIFIGFTTRTTVSHNTIVDVPWSGIAMGWGWGLLDPGSFPGLPGARSGEWGTYDTPTTSRGNQILRNRIEDFLNVLWDGGAIYTVGQQGTSMSSGTLIAGNVASGKRPAAGGNTFYTDGGSRYVTLKNNVSFDDPQGFMDLGPCPNPLDPLPYSGLPCLVNGIPYGADTGGCRTYGDLRYVENYWISQDFFTICPYTDDDGVSYPTNLRYQRNHLIQDERDVPKELLRAAGRRP
jgi:hypothetical protein